MKWCLSLRNFRKRGTKGGRIKHVRHLLPPLTISKFHRIGPSLVPLLRVHGYFLGGRRRSSIRVSNAGWRGFLRESLIILWLAGGAVQYSGPCNYQCYRYQPSDDPNELPQHPELQPTVPSGFLAWTSFNYLYLSKTHSGIEFSGERQFRLLAISSPAFENTRSDGTLENHLAPVGELLI